MEPTIKIRPVLVYRAIDSIEDAGPYCCPECAKSRNGPCEYRPTDSAECAQLGFDYFCHNCGVDMEEDDQEIYRERTITIEPARLDTDGTYLLRDIARNEHWRSIYGLVNPLERVTLTVWDNDSLGCDDTVRIRVRSTISWADRARRFGVAGLSPEHCSGKTANDGTPIPTEERIAAVEHVYGDQSAESREWRWPEWPREGDDETAWFNAAARSLYQYCRNGCFEVC